MFALLSIMLQAAAAPAGFAPPLDTPFRYVTTQTRTDAAASRTFTANRRIVFHRTADGFVAEVTLDHADQDAGGGIGAMFGRAFAALEGETIRFRLDRTGAITAVDDRDRLWDAVCAAIEGMAPQAPRQADAKAIAGMLRALPADRRQAMLRSVLTPALAGDAGQPLADGDGPVTILAHPPTGAPVSIDGTRHVSHLADGTLRIETRATGDIATPAAAHISVETARHVDPRSGLVLDSRETSRTTTGDDAAGRASETVSTVILTPLVS